MVASALVVGYALKEEFFNEAYPEPASKTSPTTALNGLNSPIFVRTVKLKDYPWNGKLHLGVRERAHAAWNPVGGFTDVMGRLIWSAVGDPAMIAFPVQRELDAQPRAIGSHQGGRPVRRRQGAGRCAASSTRQAGMLQRVGDRAVSSTKVVYEVLASPFEDGTEMTVADLLYPFAFAYRWGAEAGRGGNAHEPRLEGRLRPRMQERLVGFKVLRVDKTTHAIAEGMNVIVTDAGAGGLPQGRPRGRAAARGAGPAMEHRALASAGADGGGGGRGATPPSRRRRPPGGRFPGWTWSAIGHWERSCRT